MAKKSYTAAEVNAALNAAANLISEDGGLFDGESSDSIRVHSFIDLVVNSAMSLLREPDMTLNEIMRNNYQAEVQECDGMVYIEEGWDHGVADCGQTTDHDPHSYTEDAAAMVREWLA